MEAKEMYTKSEVKDFASKIYKILRQYNHFVSDRCAETSDDFQTKSNEWVDIHGKEEPDRETFGDLCCQFGTLMGYSECRKGLNELLQQFLSIVKEYVE